MTFGYRLPVTTCSKEQQLNWVNAEEKLCTLCFMSCETFTFVSVIRQADSPAGHCSGTAWHTASVLLLLLPSSVITRFTGECVCVCVYDRSN